jgi:preprotein translocase subunit SecG
MLLGLLLALIVLVCLALAGVVLLQRSEGGALGVGGGPSGFLTTRGAGDLLTRTTWILGGLLFALCLGMAIVQGRLKGGASVVDRLKLDPSTVPTSTFPTPTAPAAPAGGAAPAPSTGDGFGPPAPTVNVAPAVAPATTAPGAVTLRPSLSRPRRARAGRRRRPTPERDRPTPSPRPSAACRLRPRRRPPRRPPPRPPPRPRRAPDPPNRSREATVLR